MERDEEHGSRASIMQEATLVGHVWIAGLASTYGDLRLRNSTDELTDIGEALRLVRKQTLDNERVSLNDLSTMMLGLCRLVRDETQKLSITARQREDDWAQIFAAVVNDNRGATEEMEEEQQQLDPKAHLTETQNRVSGSSEKRVKHASSGNEDRTSKPKRRRKRDQRTQLTESVEHRMESEADTRGKTVPDFGLDTALKMALYRENVHLMSRPVRQLSSELAYLFARHVNVSKQRDKRRRSMTRDNLNEKRARLDCAVQDGGEAADPKEQHNKLPLSADAYQQCVNGGITVDDDEDEETADAVLDTPLNLLCPGEHYLPVRCRHLMLPRVAREIADFVGARATASIKSIIFARQRWETPFEECPTRQQFADDASHATVMSNQDSLQQQQHQAGVRERVLALLSTPSCLNRPRVFDLDSLIRYSSSSRATAASRSKQVAVSHFVTLLDLAAQGTITLSQSKSSHFSDTANVHKIYCAIRRCD